MEVLQTTRDKKFVSSRKKASEDADAAKVFKRYFQVKCLLTNF